MVKGFIDAAQAARPRYQTRSILVYIGTFAMATLLFQGWTLLSPSGNGMIYEHELKSFHAGVAQCNALALKPDNVVQAARKNPRFEAGTKPTLLRNASLIDGDGTISYRTNILMEDGIFARITDLALEEIETLKDVLVYDVQGRFVTPGLVDMHSHAGVASLPIFQGTSDDNEISDPVTSQMRVIDGIDLDDVMIKRILSGGVTSSLILPGSANVIGGEAYAIKHSAKKSLVIEDYLLQKGVDGKRQRWIKMACGENPKSVYPDKVNTRMGIGWSFRHRFDQARTLLQKQDAWCERAAAGPAALHGEPFPSDLELESMVGVLRGDVQVNNHCYNKQDFEMQIRNSREFGFEIGAFHHAHDAYRVPELLKNAPGNITVAIFANLWGYKREAFNGSPYAGKILTDANVPVAYKSDHPVTNSQHLIYHSQLATHFDLSDQLAIKAVTSVPATSLGLGHRIGYIRPGYDADLVLWDSYPLDLGAHPIQVFVDGAAQLEFTHEDLLSQVPEPSVITQDATIDVEGSCVPGSDNFVISGIKQDLTSRARAESLQGEELTLVVTNGKVSCFDHDDACRAQSTEALSLGSQKLHLQNAVIAPGITAVSLNLGLGEIDAEESTKDGSIDISRPTDPTTVIKAFDGLVFGGPHSDRADRMGVITSITAPGELSMMMQNAGDFLQGISVAFQLAGTSVLDKNAIVKKEVALHFFVGDGAKGNDGTGSESISTQIKTLRTIFSTNTSLTDVYAQAASGKLPVVIDVHNSDEMAHLILLKQEFPNVYMIFKGATEAYLLAEELAAADIPVLAIPRCVPSTWRTRKCLAGPPLSEDTNLGVLLKAHVKVGLIPLDDGALGELYWEAAWAAKLINESSDDFQLTEQQVVALISSDVRDILLLPEPAKEEFVVFSGSPLHVKSQIAVVVEGGAIKHCVPRVA